MFKILGLKITSPLKNFFAKITKEGLLIHTLIFKLLFFERNATNFNFKYFLLSLKDVLVISYFNTMVYLFHYLETTLCLIILFEVNPIAEILSKLNLLDSNKCKYNLKVIF